MPEIRNAVLSAPLAGLILVVALLACAPLASAGSYATHSCHLPSGESAPTVGWTASGFSASDTTAVDTCSRGGVNNPSGTLRAVLQREQSEFIPNDHVAWTYAAPHGVRITGYRAGLCAVADAPGQGAVSIGPEPNMTAAGTTLVRRGEDGGGFLGCGPPPYWSSGASFVERSNLSTTQLWFMAWPAEGPSRDGSYDYSRFDLAAVRILFREDSPPSVTRVSGPLASGSVSTGVLEAHFDASDIGAGLYRTIVEAKINQAGEWRTMDARPVDSLGGRCEPVGSGGGVHEFLDPVPCRPSVAGSRTALDTAQLPPGDHLIRVQVEDAAGNRADVVPPRLLHVDGAPASRSQGGGRNDVVRPPQELVPNNGQGASNRALIRLGRLGRTVEYRQPVHVTGRLVDDRDRPIADAQLQVDWRRLVPRRGTSGAPWKAIGTVTTTRDGRFRALVPTNQSRALRFSYRAHHSQDGFTSSSQYALHVRAHVSLQAVRTRVRNGQVAAFRGRVAGTVPRGGVPLTLQAWVAGRGWTPARTEQADVRTDARGRFRVGYAFSQTFEPTRYRFRVRVGEDSSFPYSTNSSRRVDVLVRP